MLQFLLGREVVASRLRVTAGQELTYGLPVAMVPEQVPVPETSAHRQVFTDRLLSRLGAASLVWHLVISMGTAEAPLDPNLLYKPVNIFDMVLEALSCVVDPDIAVEHLPGGSQLILVEPAMLLVRLTLKMRAEHLDKRLVRLWEFLCALLTRPNVHLQYSEHRPLQLIGGLLRLSPWFRAQGPAAEAVPDAAYEAPHGGVGCRRRNEAL